jgi:hypothetical protein
MKHFFGPAARAPVDDTDAASLTRRTFVARALTARGALVSLPTVLERAGLAEAAAAATPDLVTDTFNGLVAFVVPGPDAYSVAQGESTQESGGVDGFVTSALIQGLNHAAPSPPDIAGTVATLLNAAAQIVDPASTAGPFAAQFSNLSFAEKAAALGVLENAEPFAQLRSLFGILPSLVAFLAYSELAAFNPATRKLDGTPLGWLLSSYDGVADRRDAFVGYFEDRRKADA